MNWVNGVPLDQAVAGWLNQPDQLDHLRERWLRLDRELIETGIAHGDLQHGNVLVADGELRLVDYDGMFVPALHGESSHEVGHPNFQSPRRTGREFSKDLDRFSSLVIYTALLAVRHDPSLWTRYRMPADALLFRKSDFVAPDESHLFAELLRSRDPVIARLTAAIRTAAMTGTAVHSLDTLLESIRPIPSSRVVSPDHPWWRLSVDATAPTHEPQQATAVVEPAPRSLRERMRSFLRGAPRSTASTAPEPVTMKQPPATPLLASAPSPPSPHPSSTSKLPVSTGSPPQASPDASLSSATSEWWRTQPVLSTNQAPSPPSIQPPVHGIGDNAKPPMGSTPSRPAMMPSVQRTSALTTPVTSVKPTTSQLSLSVSTPLVAPPHLPLVASRVGQKYHLRSCEYGNRIAQEHAVWFATTREAQSQGFEACKVCRPLQTMRLLHNSDPFLFAPSRPFPQKVVSPSKTVTVGMTAEVLFHGGRTERFLLVPEGQRNPGTDEVSVNSPIGKALIGARAGQSVNYLVGNRSVRCVVLSVR